MVYPTAVILLGGRAYTSLLGIVLIVVGNWTADKIWDDTKNEDENAGASSPQDIVSVAGEFMESAYEFIDSTHRAITNPDSIDGKRIHNLFFRGPTGKPLLLAVFGYMILAMSCLLNCHALQGWHISVISILCTLVVLVLALIQTILRPLSMYDRTIHEHHHFFTLSLLGGYMILGFLILLDQNDAPYWMPLVGAAAIAIAPNILWFCCKRGDTYDRAAVYNPRPVLYNVAGPVLVTGWMILWIAMNCMEYDANHPDLDKRRYLPIYWTSRTAVAIEGAIAIFAAYWATGYAQDEHDDADNTHIDMPVVTVSGSSPPVPTVIDGRTGSTSTTSTRPLKSFLFGRVMEMRLIFVIAWFMMAVSALLPTWNNTGGPAQRLISLLLFLLLLAQGFAIGVQHVLGIRSADIHKLSKWTRVVTVTYILIVLLLLLSKEFAAPLLATLGCMCMGLGWIYLHRDRKRGEYWIEHGRTNPNWTVHSYGVLLFPLGLLWLAWAMTIP